MAAQQSDYEAFNGKRISEETKEKKPLWFTRHWVSCDFHHTSRQMIKAYSDLYYKTPLRDTVLSQHNGCHSLMRRNVRRGVYMVSGGQGKATRDAAKA